MKKKVKKVEKPASKGKKREEKELASAVKSASKKIKRKEKVREPNVTGGMLTIVSLVILFFVIRAYGQSGSVLGTSDSQEHAVRQQQKAKAEENIKSELSETAEGVRGNFTEVNPMDSAMESLDKVNHDVEAAKNLPSYTVETVKNMKIGDAITIVMESVGRLRKIITDANSVKEGALKKVEEMQ